MGRNTMGVRIIKLNAGDRVSSVARVVADGGATGRQRRRMLWTGATARGIAGRLMP